jgi:hypothetical protein
MQWAGGVAALRGEGWSSVRPCEGCSLATRRQAPQERDVVGRSASQFPEVRTIPIGLVFPWPFTLYVVLAESE